MFSSFHKDQLASYQQKNKWRLTLPNTIILSNPNENVKNIPQNNNLLQRSVLPGHPTIPSSSTSFNKETSDMNNMNSSMSRLSIFSVLNPPVIVKETSSNETENQSSQILSQNTSIVSLIKQALTYKRPVGRPKLDKRPNIENKVRTQDDLLEANQQKKPKGRPKKQTTVDIHHPKEGLLSNEAENQPKRSRGRPKKSHEESLHEADEANQPKKSRGRPPRPTPTPKKAPYDGPPRPRGRPPGPNPTPKKAPYDGPPRPRGRPPGQNPAPKKAPYDGPPRPRGRPPGQNPAPKKAPYDGPPRPRGRPPLLSRKSSSLPVFGPKRPRGRLPGWKLKPNENDENRGRPRKSDSDADKDAKLFSATNNLAKMTEHESSDFEADDEQEIIHEPEKLNQPKRKRGRPRKSVNEEESLKPKRPRGRLPGWKLIHKQPLSNENEFAFQPKRKIGRPRKSKSASGVDAFRLSNNKRILGQIIKTPSSSEFETSSESTLSGSESDEIAAIIFNKRTKIDPQDSDSSNTESNSSTEFETVKQKNFESMPVWKKFSSRYDH